MVFNTICVGAFRTNCYILGCETSKKAIVIDPGAESELILKTLNKSGLICEIIVNTHGHADHIGANKDLKEATGAIIAIGTLDAPSLESPTLGLPKALYDLAGGKPSPPADLLLEEGDTVCAGKIHLNVLHTPGHTIGSISLFMEGMIFSGDTIFASGGIGRTDLPGGCQNELMESIKNKILSFPGETRIYPGHGPSTTINKERMAF